MNSEGITEIFESLKCIAYPEISCISANRTFINMLQDTYSGIDGELTAILKYTYESLLFNNEEIAKIVKHIAIMEMKHLHILGGMLKKLGVPPIYQSSNKTFWTSKNVNYVMRNVTEVMKNNINSEKMAIKNYKALINCTNDECVKELIERIIMDEKTHIEVFKKILECL